jgi:enterobactin synthetase component D
MTAQKESIREVLANRPVMQWAATACPHEAVHRWSRSCGSQPPGPELRQLQFESGRECARAALLQLGETGAVGVAADRTPIWPAGFVGSITHSQNWTWAAVAADHAIRSIGIDTETLLEPAIADQLQDEIATPDEWKLANNLGWNWSTTFALLFSAKESFYKCWYPVTRAYFDFKQARLVAADRHKLTFANQPHNPNIQLGPRELDSFYFVDDQNVFTLTWMSHR